MRLLVTGGAGFMGSNFIRHMLERHPDVEIVNFDKLTYAGNLDNLSDLKSDPRYQFIQGDIVDAEVVHEAIEEHDIEAIVSFAAETHVDRSIHGGAADFVRTNVLGPQVLAEATRRHKLSLMIQISTDEVYGALGLDDARKFTEESPFAPNSPYSASKAGGDLICRSYVQTWKTPIIVTHGANNYGPYQLPEKFIPQAIFKAIASEPIPVYGDGLYVRDWLHVHDHSSAIDLLLERGSPGEVYNIGTDNERSNLEVMHYLLDILERPKTLLVRVEDRPGHDRRYAIDAAKLSQLGWQPRFPRERFVDGLRHKVEWYLTNREWVDKLRARQHELNTHIRVTRNS